MNRSKTVGVLAVFMTIVGLSSCGTRSVIKTSWELPGYAGGRFTKLAVIALMKTENESKSFEIAAVDEFSGAGIACVPGFSFLGGDTKLSQTELEQRVGTTGANGVLLFKLIVVDTTNTYVPPTDFIVDGAENPGWWEDPYWGYYTPYPEHYWGYWYPAVQVIRTPGYVRRQATYRIETALYRTSDNKLVWSAMSGTYNPKGNYDLGTSLSAAVIKKLETAGLLPGK
jgi:hypothetical protein